MNRHHHVLTGNLMCLLSRCHRTRTYHQVVSHRRIAGMILGVDGPSPRAVRSYSPMSCLPYGHYDVEDLLGVHSNIVRDTGKAIAFREKYTIDGLYTTLTSIFSCSLALAPRRSS